MATHRHLPEEVSGRAKEIWFWNKLTRAAWEEAWVDRLTEFADRLAITSLPGSRTLRLQVFQLTRAEANKLVEAFGGTAAAQKPLKAEVLAKPRAPIRVRGRLLVVSSEEERAQAVKKEKVPVMMIPAGMAFGTGEHATTASCLRLLSDVARKFEPGKWEMADLGAGTGILAIAGKILGARSVLAGDFDPDAVRVAKENVKTNEVKRVTVRKLDVRNWTPERSWEVVTANIYSELLIEVAAKLAAATAPGGKLIFSGVLREQENGVSRALRRAGFRVGEIVRRGKWIAGLAIRLSPK